MRALVFAVAVPMLACGQVGTDVGSEGAPHGGDATVEASPGDDGHVDGDAREAATDAFDSATSDTPLEADASDGGADADARPDTFDATPGDGCTTDEAVFGAIWCRDVPTTSAGGYAPLVVAPSGETIVATHDVVSELDASGAVVWSYDAPTKAPQATLDESGFSVVAPMRLSSATPAPLVVERRSADASVVWSSTFGTQVQAESVATDAAGRTIVLGMFSGSVDFGGGTITSRASGAPSGFIVSFEADGRFRWQRRFEEEILEGAIATTSTGDVVAEGTFHHSLDVGGPAPFTDATSRGGRVFVRWRDDGTYVWGTSTGEGDGTWQSTMALAPDDSIVAMFSPMDTSKHPFTMRHLAADGAELWTTFPTLSPTMAWGTDSPVASIVVDPTSTIHLFSSFYLAGETFDFGCGPIPSKSSFVVDLDIDGACLSQTAGTLSFPDFLGAGAAADGSLRALHFVGGKPRLLKLPPRP